MFFQHNFSSRFSPRAYQLSSPGFLTQIMVSKDGFHLMERPLNPVSKFLPWHSCHYCFVRLSCSVAHRIDWWVRSLVPFPFQYRSALCKPVCRNNALVTRFFLFACPYLYNHQVAQDKELFLHLIGLNLHPSPVTIPFILPLLFKIVLSQNCLNCKISQLCI